MPFDKNHPDYLDLRSRLRENPKEFVSIVGAGLSRPAGLPSWSELRDTLVENALRRESEVPEPELIGYREKLNRIKGNNDLWNSFSDLKNLMAAQYL